MEFDLAAAAGMPRRHPVFEMKSNSWITSINNSPRYSLPSASQLVMFSIRIHHNTSHKRTLSTFALLELQDAHKQQQKKTLQTGLSKIHRTFCGLYNNKQLAIARIS